MSLLEIWSAAAASQRDFLGNEPRLPLGLTGWAAPLSVPAETGPLVPQQPDQDSAGVDTPEFHRAGPVRAERGYAGLGSRKAWCCTRSMSGEQQEEDPEPDNRSGCNWRPAEKGVASSAAQNRRSRNGVSHGPRRPEPRVIGLYS